MQGVKAVYERGHRCRRVGRDRDSRTRAHRASATRTKAL